MTSLKVIIPTYNAGENFKEVLNMLLKQSIVEKEDILIVDSSSTDCTQQMVKEAGIDMIVIPKSEFGHGRTRKMATEKAGDVDIVIFMTQDALLYDEFGIENLCNYFNQDEKISAVYGRQVPYPNTDIFGTHARLFNYPETSHVRVFADKCKYGIKTAFFSDTFGAYKKDILDKMGGFPDVNFGEDTYMAGKMLIAGYKIGYCAEAKVYHSHSFTIREEYQRSKEIGRFHKAQPWLIRTFGKAEGEGLKFIKSEVTYIMRFERVFLLPVALVRDFLKFLGYKLVS